MENEYLMTNKGSQIIDMVNTLKFWRISDSNSPMLNPEASYSAKVYYQYEANGEFQTSGKSLKLWEGKKEKASIDFSQVPEFKITNKMKKNNKYENVYAIKVLITQTFHNGKENQFDIRIRRNKQKAIIMEKYNFESDKFELVQTEIFINYAGERERYHKIENLKTNLWSKHSYTVNTYDFGGSNNKPIQSIYVDEAPISNFISNHIGKTILFLLTAIALGLTWYLIPASALAMQISLAACFVLFIVFVIADEKKNFLPPPSKIFCGLASDKESDDSEEKSEEEGREEPKKELDEEDKGSKIDD